MTAVAAGLTLSGAAEAVSEPPAKPAVPPFCTDDTIIPAQALANGQATERCDLAGRTVRGRFMTVIVPPDGKTAGGASLTEPGYPGDEILVTNVNGRVTARGAFQGDWEDQTVSNGTNSTASDQSCIQLNYTHNDLKERDAFRWRMNLATTDSSITQANAQAHVTAAAVWITRGDNDCGLATGVTRAYQAYDGTTTAHANITTTGCGSRDWSNVASFRDLEPAVVGRACWWSNAPLVGYANELDEGDIAFDNSNRTWFTSLPSGCSGAFDLASVAVHEFGHLFGMGHVPEENYPWLTMSENTPVCNISARTQGRGDYKGMYDRYNT